MNNDIEAEKMIPLRNLFRVLSGALILSLLSIADSVAQNESFTPLGVPDGFTASFASGISTDGTWVVGSVRNVAGTPISPRAFRWSEDTGIQILDGQMVGEQLSHFAVGISENGQSVTGYRRHSTLNGNVGYFRWTPGNMPYFGQKEIYSMSDQGWVVGSTATDHFTYASRSRAFIDRNGQVELLTNELFPGFGSHAFGISRDGQVIVGYLVYFGDESAKVPMRWTGPGDFEELPLLSGTEYATAYAASGDGSVIVGGPTGGRDFEWGPIQYFAAPGDAFRWTQQTGTVSIGSLPGRSHSSAKAISADGSIIVGFSANLSDTDLPQNEEAFIWSEEDGMRSIKDILLDADINEVQGWELQIANSISADGTVIAGFGINPDGQQEAWRAVIGDKCIIVNSVADDPLLNPELNFCDTGSLTDDDRMECTLRAALQLANQQDERFCIKFDLPPHDLPLIQPESPLPIIQNGGDIDGSTIPEDRVEINGMFAGEGAHGLIIDADSVTIENLSITGFDGTGLWIQSGSVHELLSNYIGVDPYGQTESSENALDGIFISGGSDILIGSEDGEKGNIIAGNGLFGIHIAGEDVSDVRIFGNTIGSTGQTEEIAINTEGGITVRNGAKEIEIGTLAEDAANRISDGIFVLGEETHGVAVRWNYLEVPEDWLNGEELYLPFDVDGDGPSCFCWEGDDETPQNNVPSPRILELNADRVTGIARPLARVIAYRVEETGTERGRYLPRKLEPLGHGRADPTGRFVIGLNASEGTKISLMAIDDDGNTSEPTQIKRPIVFAPGIGGSALIGSSDGSSLWLPIGTSPNDQLFRMRMTESGESVEEIFVTGVLESEPFGNSRIVYGDILDHIEAAGYEGDEENLNIEALDLWRFPQDWRASTELLADQLKFQIDFITSGDFIGGRSCQVDFIAHSNGGLIGSIYVNKFHEEARNTIHRFVTIGTPYLGTPQAAAAQTSGYIFELEEKVPFTVDWGRMLLMTKNLPGAWGLMPSPLYWQAHDDSHAENFGYYLPDLYNLPLTSHQETFDFISRDKVNEDDIPWGLNGNSMLWQQQIENVHPLSDDWRTFEGPPYIFRFAGLLPASTAISWGLAPGREFLSPDETNRSLENDTDRHRAYRERLRPFKGYGDETVSIISATLGHHHTAGGTDFSGVEESRWIQEFEYFPCNHSELVLDDCESPNGKPLLDRLMEVIQSGYQIVSTAQPFSRIADSITVAQVTSDETVDLFYIAGSSQIDVLIEDNEGNITGPVYDNGDRVVHYEIDGMTYSESSIGAVVGLRSNKSFTIVVKAVDEPAEVEFTRIVRRSGNPSTQALYPKRTIQSAGSLSFDIDRTSDFTTDLPLKTDDEGSGEAGYVSPLEVFDSSYPGPAIPLPQPFRIHVTIPPGTTDEEEIPILLSSVGEIVWDWSVSGNDKNWVWVGEETGETPDHPILIADVSDLTEGKYSSDFSVTVEYGQVTRTYPVVLELTVGLPVSIVEEKPEDHEIPSTLELHQNYPNPFNPSTQISYSLPETSEVRLEVFNIMGQRVTVLVTGKQQAGRYNITFDASHLSSGIYLYRLQTPEKLITRRMIFVK